MILAVDLGSHDHRQAEVLIPGLLRALAAPHDRSGVSAVPAPDVVATHVMSMPQPHAALTLSWFDDGQSGYDATDLLDRTTRWCRQAAAEGAGWASVASWSGMPEPLIEHDGTAGGGLAEAALAALAQRVTRTGGRGVLLPGIAALHGTVMVAELLRRSGIDRVEGIGTGAIGDGDLVRTEGYLRPTWRSGELVLMVQPAVGGVLVPFERQRQHLCCQDHD